MSKVHRRILPVTEPRCRPQDCSIKESCSRYTSDVIQGAPVGDFKAMRTSTFYPCTYYLSDATADTSETPTKKVKPWPGDKKADTP